MNKNLELDTSKTALHEKKSEYSSKGKKYLSALDAARLTTLKRAGSDGDERSITVCNVFIFISEVT